MQESNHEVTKVIVVSNVKKKKKKGKICEVYQVPISGGLTLVLLNKLRSHTHF